MSSWGGVFRFLVAFGGGCALFAVVLVFFVWGLYKIEEKFDKL